MRTIDTCRASLPAASVRGFLVQGKLQEICTPFFSDFKYCCTKHAVKAMVVTFGASTAEFRRCVREICPARNLANHTVLVLRNIAAAT